MAKILNKFPILNQISKGFLQGDNLMGNISGKAMRAKIEIWDRSFRGFERVNVNGPRDAYNYEATENGWPGYKDARVKITDDNIERTSGIMVDPNAMQTDRKPTNDYYAKNNITRDFISIIDYDYKPTTDKTNTTQSNSENKPKLSNRRYKEMRIPFIPRELQFSPESNFVGISSFGRNNPFYQYTGGEDTLTFEIDWLSDEASREDVITKCRWIEALTKGDGYEDVPHRIILMWGAENKLFKDDKWIVTAAPYKVFDFSRGFVKDGTFTNNHLLPTRASQLITLKKVTDDNRRSSDIIGNLNMK